MSKLSMVVSACALSLFLVVACSQDGATPSSAEPHATLRAPIVIGPDVDSGEDEEDDFEVSGLPVSGYVYPRDFPAQQASFEHRKTALTALHAMRTALDMGHFDPDGAPETAGCDSCTAIQACLFNGCRDRCPHQSEIPLPCPSGFDKYTPPGTTTCYCVPSDAATDAGGTGGPGAPGCGWTSAGPTNIPGRISSLTFAADGMTLYAGTVGGLWSSPDKGRRWRRLKVGAAFGTTVGDVAINTASGEVIVGMFDPANQSYQDGIWLSPTGATDTFTQISNDSLENALLVPGFSDSKYPVQRIVASPSAGGEVYLAAQNGVYVGTRSGGTFTWSLLGAKNFFVDDIDIDFSGATPIVYAAARSSGVFTGDGIWKYADGTWTQISNGITVLSHIGRAQVARSGSTLYARFVIFGTTATSTIFRSDDSGGTWTPLPNSSAVVGQLGYTFLLEVDPNNPAVVYAGATDLWRSTNSGQDWTDINPSPDPSFASEIHPDQHALAFDPTNSRVLYAGTDGGVFLSTDTTQSTWHWTPRAHGMRTTQFYKAASQLATASLVTGGSQDNGTEITFGNQTWYQSASGDGVDVGVDATNSSTLYTSLNGDLYEITNPVVYSRGGGTAFSANAMNPALQLKFPDATTSVDRSGIGLPVIIATDPTVGGTAIVRGVTGTPQTKVVLETTDGVNFANILTLPANVSISALAISIASPKHYYAATFDSSATTAAMYTSTNGGQSFNGPVPAGTSLINHVAVDPTNAGHAWLATEANGVLETVNDGASWNPLPPSDVDHALPDSLAVTGLAANATELYAATNVGVLKGTVAAGTVAWAPFDDGLPDGLDVNDIWLNPQTSTLFIGGWGLGGYRRRLTDSTCSQVKLLVRDSVFDQGQTPTPNGVPDPEHPISHPKRANFFKPDDTDGGKVYYWESPDIRTTLPSICGVTTPDHVEFESCPVEAASCPPWVMTSVEPVRGQTANVSVQVQNQGTGSAANVRVVAMYADASAGVPPLPTSFWTQTAQPGVPSCGTLDETTGWHLVGCQTIDEVSARVPEVTTFSWSVPTAAAEHTCLLTIVDSAADPITNTSTDVEALSINDVHVAHRNLHLVDGPSAVPCTSPGPNGGGSVNPGTPFSGLTTLNVPNRWNVTGGHRVLLSRSGMEQSGRLSFLLPTGAAAGVSGLPQKCGVSATTTGAVAISLPRGLVADGLALSANYRLELDDRVSVVDAAGAPDAPVGNAGSAEVNVGAYAKLGSVFSAGNVTLRDHSSINGGVTYGGTLAQQSNVTVTGAFSHTSGLSPSDLFSWTVQYPATTAGDGTLAPNQQRSLAPGRFGRYSVNAGAVLKLSSGTYYFDSLTFESGSVLELNQHAGPTIINTRQGFTFRGQERASSGATSPPDVLLIALGTNDVFIETPFTGTVGAPTARLTLGGGTGRYIGSFYAKELIVRPDIVVQQRLSQAWATLPACKALSTQERSKATAAGLAPDLYSAGSTQLYQTWPVPFGQSWIVGLRYESGTGRQGTASRFRIMSLQGSDVKGGNTFVLRQ